MLASDLADLKILTHHLILDFKGLLSWKKDTWVGSYLAEFKVEQQETVKAILLKYLPHTFTQENIQVAPLSIQHQTAKIGGIKPKQWLVSSQLEAPVVLLGAWWPWGNGQKISLRLFLAANQKAQAESLG